MDNDQRDRRDWPAPEPTGDAGDAAGEATRPAGEEPAVGGEIPPEAPPAPDWGATEAAQSPVDEGPSAAAAGDEAPAEMESWPSQDAVVSDEGDAGFPEAAAADAPTPDASAPWPTEPPPAGSATAGTWPTAAPERGDEPAMAEGTGEPVAAPPPGEVETDPADSASVDLAAGAGLAAAGAAAPGAPDAEAAVGESTQCPRCGTENRPGLAFCRNCGQRLVAAGVATTLERPGTPEGTQACPRCGTHNRAGTAFCQNCGANLRGTAPGYVPPAVATAEEPTATTAERRGAVLGPVVLLIGAIGLVTGYLLPFLFGQDSLFDRAFGDAGYGAAFWTAYPDVDAGLANQAYFGLAAPVPLLAALLAILAVAGFARARPGTFQTLGLVIALAWSVGLAVLFLVVEVAGNWDGDLVGLLRLLTPAGIIFFLASLIVLIGTLTRFGRS